MRVRITALEGRHKRSQGLEDLDRLDAIENGIGLGHMDMNQRLVQELGCVGQLDESIRFHLRPIFGVLFSELFLNEVELGLRSQFISHLPCCPPLPLCVVLCKYWVLGHFPTRHIYQRLLFQYEYDLMCILGGQI